ncbi:MAG TPA: DUF4926 domain-containing protein [Longimicrobiales bacterium]|nr:DUF4926 domain-containing protein [Longimicrobiales bacterium]
MVLTRAAPEHGLEPGDVGTLVTRHAAGGYGVEFVSAVGDTVAVLTLTDSNLRPMGEAEILHVRGLSPL